jgi:hypothetical protein
MEAIKKHGAKCLCCGATPSDGIRINVDHIKPRKKFPHLALDLNNLQVLIFIILVFFVFLTFLAVIFTTGTTSHPLAVLTTIGHNSLTCRLVE